MDFFLLTFRLDLEPLGVSFPPEGFSFSYYFGPCAEPLGVAVTGTALCAHWSCFPRECFCQTSAESCLLPPRPTPPVPPSPAASRAPVPPSPAASRAPVPPSPLCCSAAAPSPALQLSLPPLGPVWQHHTDAARGGLVCRHGPRAPERGPLPTWRAEQGGASSCACPPRSLTPPEPSSLQAHPLGFVFSSAQDVQNVPGTLPAQGLARGRRGGEGPR